VDLSPWVSILLLLFEKVIIKIQMVYDSEDSDGLSTACLSLVKREQDSGHIPLTETSKRG